MKLILLLGGDSTFLKSAGIINNTSMPLLGINSDPTRRVGALCNVMLDFDKREEQIPQILDKLQTG